MKCRPRGDIGAIFREVVKEEYLIVYPGGFVLER